jgi:hypothetical protein
MKRSGNLLFTAVPIFIAMVFVFIIVWHIVIGTVAVKLVGTIQDDGLKAVIEQVWGGKSNE